MRCPTCGKEFELATSPAKPFCSDRCRSIDLGRWLDETYSLPYVPDPEADELPEGFVEGKSADAEQHDE